MMIQPSQPLPERPKPVKLPLTPVSSQHYPEGYSQIAAIQFGILSPIAMQNEARVLVRDRQLLLNAKPVPGGVLDEHMGVYSRNGKCQTCNESLKNCLGHCGIIEFARPVWHCGYFKHVLHILHCICKSCSRVLLPADVRASMLQIMLRPDMDSTAREHYYKVVLSKCKKNTLCFHCGMPNGTVRKAPNAASLRVVHDMFANKAFQRNSHRMQCRANDVAQAILDNSAIVDVLNEASETITAARAHRLLCRIPEEELPLMWCSAEHARPEDMVLVCMLVPPLAIRPSVTGEFNAGSTEDDLTIKLQEIVTANEKLRREILIGSPLKTQQESQDQLTNAVTQFIDGDKVSAVSSRAASEASKGPRKSGGGGVGRAAENDEQQVLPPDLPATMAAPQPAVDPRASGQKMGPGRKPIRGLIQRIKGKQGRFRGNLSGKRVDYSGRTVISPDPNLGVEEVGLPRRMAMRLTFPEAVHEHNVEDMKTAVANGPHIHPGAVIIRRANGRVTDLKVAQGPHEATTLAVGDVVERHVRDGDIVLFNRQPSLHRMSIMAHIVRVLEGNTLRFNECCCAPYNADFDGDEMNVHVPQTVEAACEARLLMAVTKNLVTPRNGEPLVAATQDFITGSFALTSRDQFFSREQFLQIAAQAIEISDTFRIPRPAIVRPVALWTGKQVWSCIINLACKGKTINLIVKERLRFKDRPGLEFASDMVLCNLEGLVEIQNNEIMCGSLGKSSLGGSKASIFYAILRDVGEDACVSAMNRMTKAVPRWFSQQGFSFGIKDVVPPPQLLEQKRVALAEGFASCLDTIEKARTGELPLKAGCDLDATLEELVSGTLSRLRDKLGQSCMDSLPLHNAPRIMALCGSKGSALNICQMVVCVGQQIVNGKRIPDGFDERSLPHFALKSKEPEAKGFVQSSFYSGLTAPEFFFHTMAGREGLVDTAVKTAETGYMARRLVKALEDLSVAYDGTVRDATKSVVQFVYGDDGLNPFYMEAQGPVDFGRLEQQVRHHHAAAGGQEDAEFTALLQTYREGGGGGKARGAEWVQHAGLWKDLRTRLPAFFGLRQLPETSELADSGKDFFFDTLKKAVGDVKEPMTVAAWARFLRVSTVKARQAIVEPGEAVGAIAAQSLGEPGTQMTLKTFHFAGVASMSVTLGVPRLKEIINASKDISTPYIKLRLCDDQNKEQALRVKAQVESLPLGDLCHTVDIRWDESLICIYLADQKTRDDLGVGHIDAEHVCRRIIADKARLKIKNATTKVSGAGDYIEIEVDIEGGGKRAEQDLKVEVGDGEKWTMTAKTLKLKTDLMKLSVCGNPVVTRAVVSIMEQKEAEAIDRETELLPTEFERAFARTDAKAHGLHLGRVGYYEAVRAHNEAMLKAPLAEEKYEIVVEGKGLLEAMGIWGVDPSHTFSNNILEVEKVLGIEAARSVIIKEIKFIFERYGLVVDLRHLLLLADVMTYKGLVLGITRFGIAKMKDSVLSLASFEKTADHLLDGAAHGRRDDIRGVSECIVVGSPIPMGTGAMELVFDQHQKPYQVKVSAGTQGCEEEEEESGTYMATLPEEDELVIESKEEGDDEYDGDE